MIDNKPTAALFDLDGVVFDTETQYSIFWGEQGRKYHPEIARFEHIIKGQTLTHIYETYFPDEAVQQQLTVELNDFERNMPYDFIPGVAAFLADLKKNGVCMAVVTSSNRAKMDNVRRQHPDFDSLFDRVLTSEDFAFSKPHPDCYLKGAAAFGAPIQNCVVFEDSFNGLKSGKAANMCTIGLATTNTRSEIEPLCDLVIDNFNGFTYKTMNNLLNQ